MSGARKLRNHEATAEGLSGVSLPEVFADGNAERRCLAVLLTFMPTATSFKTNQTFEFVVFVGVRLDRVRGGRQKYRRSDSYSFSVMPSFRRLNCDYRPPACEFPSTFNNLPSLSKCFQSLLSLQIIEFYRSLPILNRKRFLRCPTPSFRMTTTNSWSLCRTLPIASSSLPLVGRNKFPVSSSF